MPHCLKPGKGRDPARRETCIYGLFAIVLDCGDSRETWINMLLFGSHLPGLGIGPLAAFLPWLVIVVAEMLPARGALYEHDSPTMILDLARRITNRRYDRCVDRCRLRQVNATYIRHRGPDLRGETQPRHRGLLEPH